jgi:protein-L-isoaspartate(D-aspartate) O-methyltransferase
LCRHATRRGAGETARASALVDGSDDGHAGRKAAHETEEGRAVHARDIGLLLFVRLFVLGGATQLSLGQAERGGDFAQRGAARIGPIAAEQLIDVGRAELGTSGELGDTEPAFGELAFEDGADTGDRARGSAPAHAAKHTCFLRDCAVNVRARAWPRDGLTIRRVTVESSPAQLRDALVRAMLRNGSLHPGPIEQAFRRVPRHLFLPDVDLDLAYRDTSIPTKLQGGEIVSSSSQPAIMAIMLEQLGLASGQRVLEIGAGTGYNAALIAELVGEGGQVTTIDLDADVVERARAALVRAGYDRVRVEQADGSSAVQGSEQLPFDRIIATVGLGDIPLAFWSQLAIGGQLVLPLALRGVMKSVALRKNEQGHLVSTSVHGALFMPFRGVAPLVLRERRLGPELGLFAWSTNPDLDLAGLYATLQQTDFQDISSDLQLTRRELSSGLNLWLRAHLSSFVQIHLEGAQEAASSVPAFMRSPFAHPAVRDRLSIGSWENGELALLSTSSDQAETLPVWVRAWGGRRLADQLVDCIRAWRAANSPSEDDLELELVPHGGQLRAAASIPMSAGTLELTWRRRD